MAVVSDVEGQVEAGCGNKRGNKWRHRRVRREYRGGDGAAPPGGGGGSGSSGQAGSGDGGAITLADRSTDGTCWLIWRSAGGTWYGAQTKQASCTAPPLASVPSPGVVTSATIGWQQGSFPGA